MNALQAANPLKHSLQGWRAERSSRVYWRKVRRNDKKFSYCWIPNCYMCPEIRRQDHARILAETRRRFKLPDIWKPK